MQNELKTAADTCCCLVAFKELTEKRSGGGVLPFGKLEAQLLEADLLRNDLSSTRESSSPAHLDPMRHSSTVRLTALPNPFPYQFREDTAQTCTNRGV